MKKHFILFIMAFVSATMTFAQDCNKCDKHGKAPTDMVQKKTNDMVALYNLNEKQAAQLLELNKEYAAKLAPARPRHHAHRHGASAQHQCDKQAKGHNCDKQTAKQCDKQKAPALCDECKKGGKCEKCAMNNCTDCDPVNGKHCTKCKQPAKQCDKKPGHECDKQADKQCDKKPGHECDKNKHRKGHQHAAMPQKEDNKLAQQEYEAKLKKIMTSKQFKQYQQNKNM